MKIPRGLVPVGLVLVLLSTCLMAFAVMGESPAGGAPLAIVKVIVKNSGGSAVVGAYVKVSNPASSFTNSTDANGEAVFDLLGIYSVLVTHGAYQPSAKYFKVDAAMNVNIVLKDAAARGATLSGKVKDAVTDNGVQGVSMSFDRMDMLYSNRSSTNASGDYSVTLVQGWYLVSTVKAGYLDYSEIVHVSGAVTHDMVIALLSDVTGQVSGTVMDLFTGKAAVGGKVKAYGPGGWWNETTIGAGGAYSLTALKTEIKIFASNSSKSNISKMASAFPATVNFNIERDLEAPSMGCTPSPVANVSTLKPITMKGWTVDNYDPIKYQFKSIKTSQLLLGRFVRTDAGDNYFSAWSEFAENDSPRMYASVPTDFTGTNQFALIEYNFTWNTAGSYGQIGDSSLIVKDEVSFASGPRTGGMLEVYGEVVSPKYNHTASIAVFPSQGGPPQAVIANVTGTSELIYPADQPTTQFAKRDIIYRVSKGTGDAVVYEETSKNSYPLSNLTSILSGHLQSGRYAVIGHSEDFALNSMTNKKSEFTVDNDLPLANAGPDEKLYVGNTTYLDGTNSTDNVGITSYVWTFVDGSQPKTLQGSNVSYKFSNVGKIDVTLTVTDGGFNNNSDVKTVDVIPIPPDTEKPVAIADIPLRTTPHTVISFDGSRSHDNIGIVNYWWTFTDVEDQNLSGKKATYSGFNATGRYAITLTVCDLAGNCDTDSVTVLVSNKPSDQLVPIANAGGNRAVIQRGTVKCSGGFPDVTYPGKLMLDGSSSDGSGSEIIRYEWTLTDPLGGVTNYSGATANVTFTIAGAHTVTLEVWDEGLNYASTTITINVVPFDSNADGLPDDWETRYFGSITKYKGNEDPDHDGYSNIEELCRNSDPTIPDVENRPTTFASEYWWLFLVIALIVLIVIVGIFYSRRPRLLEPEEAPVIAPTKKPLTPFGIAPAVTEEQEESNKVVDKEEEELKEIIDGNWDKPKEEELS